MARIYQDRKGYARWSDTEALVHRSVAAKMVGGTIFPGMEVHHKDGDKMNFRKSNLVIMTKSDHAKLHAKHRKKFK
jgi:hypothetical protein